MTEREKRIEEMAKQGLEKKRILDEMCKIAYPIYPPTDREYRALMNLVDADYRKADEVRGETAIEYSNKIDEIVDWCISNKSGDDFDYEYFTNCLRNLKKEFGVEVEE